MAVIISAPKLLITRTDSPTGKEATKSCELTYRLTELLADDHKGSVPVDDLDHKWLNEKPVGKELI